ncbi:hypothetical protein RRG08_048652 [Elysia crispata]|uniref:Uncharacterized protein n=1 Tax=Elysia crispata TaxID=231223 RepID=A0AAE1DXU4_9GAST|nr:hypothetical protein RRG08_048652 [Elysia crispata]
MWSKDLPFAKPRSNSSRHVKSLSIRRGKSLNGADQSSDLTQPSLLDRNLKTVQCDTSEATRCAQMSMID